MPCFDSPTCHVGSLSVNSIFKEQVFAWETTHVPVFILVTFSVIASYYYLSDHCRTFYGSIIQPLIQLVKQIFFECRLSLSAVSTPGDLLVCLVSIQRTILYIRALPVSTSTFLLHSTILFLACQGILCAWRLPILSVLPICLSLDTYYLTLF
jgi:hypothetical protein